MKITSNTLIRLTKKHIKPAAEVVARAFHDYPSSKYIFPDASKRFTQQKYVFQSALCYGILYGETFATSPNLEGIAVWLPPNNVYETPWKMMRCMNLPLLFNVSLNTAKRSMPFMLYLNDSHKRIAPFPHWYLQLLAVDPKHQGKGFGNLLVKTMIKRIDQKKFPIYVDTNTKKNVSFYQNHGFKVVEGVLLPSTNVPVWCLLREAAI